MTGWEMIVVCIVLYRKEMRSIFSFTRTREQFPLCPQYSELFNYKRKICKRNRLPFCILRWDGLGGVCHEHKKVNQKEEEGGRERERCKEGFYASFLVGADREVKIKPEGQGSPIRDRRARFSWEGSTISILEYRETIREPTVLSS
jgi:hypothetical protein